MGESKNDLSQETVERSIAPQDSLTDENSQNPNNTPWTYSVCHYDNDGAVEGTVEDVEADQPMPWGMHYGILEELEHYFGDLKEVSRINPYTHSFSSDNSNGCTDNRWYHMWPSDEGIRNWESFRTELNKKWIEIGKKYKDKFPSYFSSASSIEQLFLGGWKKDTMSYKGVVLWRTNLYVTYESYDFT